MWNTDHFFERIETTFGADHMLRAREGVPYTGVYIRPHVHLEHEIMWFRKAEGYYSIGSEKLPIKNNTLAFVPSMILHDMELQYTEDHERFLIQYDSTVLNRLKYPFPGLTPDAGFILQLDEIEAERIQFLFNWFTQLHDSPHSPDEIDPLFILLLNTVFLHARNAEKIFSTNDKSNTFDHIINFVTEIENKKNYNMSLDDAAFFCGLSPSHFSRTFKKIMHISFKEYLLRKKISLAAEMLRNTNMSITEIAYQCEFTDSAYFCFKFKEMMSVTPRKFRVNTRSTQQLSTKHDRPQSDATDNKSDL